MAARDAFIDTSVLYAVVDKRDAYHAAARDTVGALLRSGRLLVTSDYVVAETINLANARGGTHVALRILDLLERSAGIRVEWIGPLRFDQTKAFFRKHAGRKRNWSEIFHPTEIRRLIAQRSSEVTRGEKHSSALNATQSSGKIPSRVSVTRSAQENSPAFFAPHHRNSSSESRRRFRDDPALVVRPSLQQP